MVALKQAELALTRSPLITHTLVFCLSADDHSRVRLLVLDGDPHSDYINANYIDVRLFMGLRGWGSGGCSRLKSAGLSPSQSPRQWVLEQVHRVCSSL